MILFFHEPIFLANNPGEDKFISPAKGQLISKADLKVFIWT